MALRPEQRKIIVFAALFVVAIPCLMLMARNFKRHAANFGGVPVFKTSTDLNVGSEMSGSVNDLIETQQQIDQQMQLLETVGNEEFSTSEVESYLGNTTLEDFFSATTSSTSAP